MFSDFGEIRSIVHSTVRGPGDPIKSANFAISTARRKMFFSYITAVDKPRLIKAARLSRDHLSFDDANIDVFHALLEQCRRYVAGGQYVRFSLCGVRIAHFDMAIVLSKYLTWMRDTYVTPGLQKMRDHVDSRLLGRHERKQACEYINWLEQANNWLVKSPETSVISKPYYIKQGDLKYSRAERATLDPLFPPVMRRRTPEEERNELQALQLIAECYERPIQQARWVLALLEQREEPPVCPADAFVLEECLRLIEIQQQEESP